MRGDRQPQATVHVEESYIYEVDLGKTVTFNGAEGDIRVLIPYSGRELEGVRQVGQSLAIGHLTMETADEPSSAQQVEILIPGGSELTNHLKSGSQAAWSLTYTPSASKKTLINVTGGVFDNSENNTDTLKKLVEGKIETFSNELCLKISLWVPNLFKQAQRDRKEILRELLLQQSNATQIFLANVDDADRVAQSLVALANSFGGRILVGVDERGRVIGIPGKTLAIWQEKIEAALLKAAVLCNPPIHFTAPEYLEDAFGRVVALIAVPKSKISSHNVRGYIYRRESNRTIFEGTAGSEPAQAVVSGGPAAETENSGEPGKAIIWLDAEGATADTVALGPAICALVNAEQPGGEIHIRNLGRSTGGLFFLRRPRSPLEQVAARLDEELHRCTSSVYVSAPQLTTQQLDGREESVIVIKVDDHQVPIALYNGLAYRREQNTVNNVALHLLFKQYLKRTGASEITYSTGGQVQLVYGEIGWPLHPPTLPATNDERVATYDFQRQAMTWQQKTFDDKAGTAGASYELVLPLPHALMTINDQGNVATQIPQLVGTFYIKFDDVLASDLEINCALNDLADESGHWPGAIPVYKHTYLQLNVTAELDKLFQNRQRSSLLRFRLPDVWLDRERVLDIRKACLDCGFRIQDNEDAPLGDREGNRLINFEFFEGIRSKGYYDIQLLAGVACQSTPLTRELRYAERTDSKQTESANADIWLLLSGKGEKAAHEIAHLYILLYETINKRLQYLRAE